MEKTLEYYLSLPYRLEIIPNEDGGYAAAYPELPGCLTCSETLDGILESADDAKKAWLCAALEDGEEIPEPRTDESYSGQFKLRIPRGLHRQLAEQSRLEGVSMNQYCAYLLASSVARRRV